MEHFKWLFKDLKHLKMLLNKDLISNHKAHQLIWKWEKYFPVKTRTYGVYSKMNKYQLVKLINAILSDERYY